MDGRDLSADKHQRSLRAERTQRGDLYLRATIVDLQWVAAPDLASVGDDDFSRARILLELDADGGLAERIDSACLADDGSTHLRRVRARCTQDNAAGGAIEGFRTDPAKLGGLAMRDLDARAFEELDAQCPLLL